MRAQIYRLLRANLSILLLLLALNVSASRTYAAPSFAEIDALNLVNTVIVSDGQPYKIGRFLGSGGLAHVYVVTKPGNDTEYVLKLFTGKNKGFDHQRVIKNHTYQRNTQIPGLIQVFAVSKFQSLQFEGFVDGVIIEKADSDISTLRELKIQEAESDIELKRSIDKLEELMRFGLSTIDYLKARDVAHRDWKAENVLTKDGRFRGGDLDLLESVRSSSMAYGTPGFIAPEVYWGEPQSYRSDLFAWGMTMAEVILGNQSLAYRREKKMDMTEYTADMIYEGAWKNIVSFTSDQLMGIEMSLQDRGVAKRFHSLRRDIIDLISYDPSTREKVLEKYNAVPQRCGSLF